MKQDDVNENIRNIFQTLSIELAQILAMSRSIFRSGTTCAECNSWARWIRENLSILISNLRMDKDERAGTNDASSSLDKVLEEMIHIKSDADKLSGINSLQEICMEHVQKIIDQLQQTQVYVQTCITITGT